MWHGVLSLVGYGSMPPAPFRAEVQVDTPSELLD